MISVDEIVGWENAQHLPSVQEFVDRVGRVLFSFDDSVKANVEIVGESMTVTFFLEEGVPLVEVFASAAEGAWHLYGTNMNPSGGTCKSCCSGGSCPVPSQAWEAD